MVLFLLQTIIPTAFSSQVGNPYLTGLGKGCPRLRSNGPALVLSARPALLLTRQLPYDGLLQSSDRYRALDGGTTNLRNSFISHLRLITVKVLVCGAATHAKSLEAVTTLQPYAAALARRIHS